MVIAPTAQPPDLMPWETAAAEPALDSSMVPPDRIYIFYPEEPFSFINLPGNKLRQFHNGRLMSDQDNLTEDDLRYLVSQRDRQGQLRYLFCKGDPRADSGLRVRLQQRFTIVAAKKAAASNALKIVDDVNFMLLSAIAVTGDQPALQAFDGGGANQMRTIGALLPSAMQDVEAKLQLTRFDDQERDAAVIAEAASGRVDDSPAPEEDLPTEFSPPPGVGEKASSAEKAPSVGRISFKKE